jgi:hypothetical protein
MGYARFGQASSRSLLKWSVGGLAGRLSLPIAQRWAAERRPVPAAPRDEHDVVRKGGRFSATVPPSMGEPSSWPEQLECSPSLVWL